MNLHSKWHIPVWLSRSVMVLCIAVVLIFRIWEMKFGINLMDEMLFYLGGFKFFSKDSGLLSYSTAHALRHFDLLNYYLIRPFVSFSVLGLRHASMFFFFGLLCALYFSSFGRKLAWWPVLLLSLLLLIEDFLPWSHYYWIRNLFIFQSVFLLLAQRTKVFSLSMLYAAIAGIGLGLVEVAHSVMLVSLFLSSLIVSVFMILRSHNSRDLKLVFVYFGAAISILGLHWLYILEPENRLRFFESVLLLSTLGKYVTNTSVENLGEKLVELLLFPQLWSLFLIDRLVILRKKSLATTLVVVVSVGTLILFSFVAIRITTVFCPAGTILALGLYCGFRILKKSWASFNPLGFVFGMVPLIYGLIIFLVGDSGYSVWLAVTPSLLFTGVPLLVDKWKEDRRFRVGTIRFRSNWLAQVLAFCLVIIIFKSFQFHTSHAGDAERVKESTVQLTVAPFKGLYTSSRRAYLINEVVKSLNGRKHIVAYTRIPFVYMLPEVTSPTNAIVFVLRASSLARQVEFQKMIEHEKFPEVIVEAKEKAWSWGKTNPSVQAYSEQYVWKRFRTCATGPPLLDYPEIAIYPVIEQRVDGCVQKIYQNLYLKNIG